MTASHTHAATRERPPGWAAWAPSMPLLIAMVAQLAAAVWWGASLEARVDSLEQLRPEVAGVPAELARLDERSQMQSAALQRLTDDADRRDAAREAAAR